VCAAPRLACLDDEGAALLALGTVATVSADVARYAAEAAALYQHPQRSLTRAVWLNRRTRAVAGAPPDVARRVFLSSDPMARAWRSAVPGRQYGTLLKAPVLRVALAWACPF